MQRRGNREQGTGNRGGPVALYRSLPAPLRRFLPFALVLALLYLLIDRQWYSTAPEGNPELGVNFSCERTKYLDLNCRDALASVLDDLGVRLFRLSVQWSDVEKQPGVYDWSVIDWQLDELHRRGAKALVSVGMKAQRYPEFWLPTWMRLAITVPQDGYPGDEPLVQQHLFPYLEATTRHLAAHPAVEAFQVENEPFVHSRGYANAWHVRKEFLVREIETVRAADPSGRKVVVSHSSWLRRDQTWKWILDHADVMGQSVYPKWQWSSFPRWFYVYRYRLGPLTPNLPGQAREAERRGKAFWITELQAEPFEKHGVDARREPLTDLRSFSPRLLRDNLRLARRSGASRVYLWGIEWWLYLRQARQDAELWEIGRTLWTPG
jgi:hypothetical protein